MQFNYCRQFSDYITNFCFGRGIRNRVPKMNEAVTPALLHRVWEEDNHKQTVLWEFGNMGSVTGDGFMKVAYEEPWIDSMGVRHQGKVRLIPLNSSHCYPEWHPHDRDRMVRIKIKYRFWGCFTPETEALTREGWKTYDQLTDTDEIYTIDPTSGKATWQTPTAVNVYDYDGDMVSWEGRGFSALSTPNHRWMAQVPRGRMDTFRYVDHEVMSELVSDMPAKSRLTLAGGAPMGFRDRAKYSDELVESVAWYVCDGSDHVNQTGYGSVHLAGKKPHKVAAWRRLATYWTAEGATWNEGKTRANGQSTFYLGAGVVDALHDVAPDRVITPEFLCSLTYAQARLFRDTLVAADGHRRRNSVRWTQVDEARKDAYQMLCAMLGFRTAKTSCGEKVQEYITDFVGTEYLNTQTVHYTGKVWCPTVPSGFFMARHNGTTFWTGNTASEGTRSVFTWTEVIDENEIQEYVNDERIDVRPNPIGAIPVVHAANMPVSGSPWGLSDITDIIPLNRQFNETAEMVQDIINYHAEPVTIVTGAKADQMERGSNKMWHGLPEQAKVFNLELGSNLGAPTGFLDLLKRSMHEMTGVPEMALGQFQPISNTSGVALQIAFQPLMNRRNLKAIQYGRALAQVNELILRTLAVKEPWAFQHNPMISPELREDQVPVLDPTDPMVYRTEVDFPDPLPLDQLIRLNELQAKITMGLESKRGALRDLGEEFPDTKIAEIMEERKDDLMEDGIMNMLRAHLEQAIYASAGSLPMDMLAPTQREHGAGGQPADTGEGQAQNGGRPAGGTNPLSHNLARLMEGAYATKWNSLKANPEQAGASGES